MAISIKQLTINTKVNKTQDSGEDTAPAKQGGGSLSKRAKEVLINECLERVRELIQYEYNP